MSPVRREPGIRIVFITYSFLPNIGGVERSVANLAQRLCDRGHDVTIVTHDYWAIPFRTSRGRGRPRVLRIHIPAQTIAPAWEKVRRTLINAVNLAVLSAYCVLRRVDVVHCHFLNMDSLYGRRLQQLLRRPFVLTVRGGETEEWITSERRARFVDERLREADFVTTVAESLRHHAIRRVPEVDAKSAVVPNPLTDAECAPRGPHPTEPYLLFVGRLVFMKDVGCLVDAFHRILAADPTFGPRLKVVGDGELRAELEARARAGPARDRIDFVGPLPHADVLGHIEGALGLVLPSRCSEGCPNVILEARLLGTCVVVSDLPALTELVDDRVDGLVHPVGDAEALAARLVELSGDGGLRDTLARAARARQLRSHGWDAVLDRYEAIYAEVLATPGRARC